MILLEGATCNPSRRPDQWRKKSSPLGIIVASRQPAYSDREKAYTATQNVLQSTPDIAGVFAANDEQARALRAPTERQEECAGDWC